MKFRVIQCIIALLSFMLLQNAPGAITVVSDPPATIAAVAGTTVNIQATVTSDLPGKLLLQWCKGGSPITKTGSTTNKLTLSGIKAGIDDGDYSLRIAEPTAPTVYVYTNIAAVTVNTAPKIKTQPAALTATEGQTANLQVVMDPLGTTPFTFTWQKKTGTIWGDLLGGPNDAQLSIVDARLGNAGSYRVKVTNITGVTVTSAEAVLKVNSRPVILTPLPATLFVATGGTGKLTVVAGGNAPMTYQWFKGTPGSGTPIPNAKAASLTIKGIETPTDSVSGPGDYYVQVTNGYSPGGVATVSTATTVTVIRKPTILTQPAKASTLNKGDNHTITVVPSTDNTGTLTYQWQKDGKNIADAVIVDPAADPRTIAGTLEATLRFTPISWLDRGSYKVIIKNEVGSITSAASVLTVHSAPIIITQPVGVRGPTKGSASFSVVAGGDATLKYQWAFKPTSGEFADILNAKAAKLSVTNLAPASIGEYKCKVTNGFGNAESIAVHLQVDDPPKITTPPAPLKVKVGDPIILSVVATGTELLNYAWQKGNSNIVGASNSNSFIIPVSDYSDSGSYRVIVTNLVGTATSAAVAVAVQDVPRIVTDPVSASGMEDKAVSMSVVAAGTATLKYQWHKLNTTSVLFEPVAGKTAATLTFPTVQLSDIGTYHCVVTNDVGSATSADADISVVAIPVATVGSFYPAIARAGDKVRLFGTNFQYTKSVSVNTPGTNAGFVIESDTSLLITVPRDASTVGGKFNVTSKHGTASTVGLFQLSGLYANNYANESLLFGTTQSFSGSTADIKTVHGGVQSTWMAWYRWRIPKPSVVTITATGQFGFDLDMGMQLCNAAGVANGLTDYSDVINGNVETTSLTTTFDNQEVEFSISGVRGAHVANPTGTFTVIATTAAVKTGAGATAPPVEAVISAAGWKNTGSTESVTVASQTITFGGDQAATEPVFLWSDESAQSGIGASTTASFTMRLESGQAGGDDTFSWQVEDSDGESLIALVFDTATGEISVVESDGTAHSTGQHMVPGSPHQFEISVDNQAGTWTATMDGVALSEPVALTGGAVFGNVSAVWGLGADGRASGALMNFEKFKVISYQ